MDLLNPFGLVCFEPNLGGRFHHAQLHCSFHCGLNVAINSKSLFSVDPRVSNNFGIGQRRRNWDGISGKSKLVISSTVTKISVTSSLRGNNGAVDESTSKVD